MNPAEQTKREIQQKISVNGSVYKGIRRWVTNFCRFFGR